MGGIIRAKPRTKIHARKPNGLSVGAVTVETLCGRLMGTDWAPLDIFRRLVDERNSRICAQCARLAASP